MFLGINEMIKSFLRLLFNPLILLSTWQESNPAPSADQSSIFTLRYCVLNPCLIKIGGNKIGIKLNEWSHRFEIWSALIICLLNLNIPLQSSSLCYVFCAFDNCSYKLLYHLQEVHRWPKILGPYFYLLHIISLLL